ncbi:MAG: hypothetical protein ACI9K9_002209, partial [Neolewinella sp.]
TTRALILSSSPRMVPLSSEENSFKVVGNALKPIAKYV